MSDENKAIWKALDEYFEHAGSDRNGNIRLARPSIDRWNRAFILGGFQWVAERIEKEGAEATKMATYDGSLDVLLDQSVFTVAKRSLGQLRDLLSTLGNEAGSWLVAQLQISWDEDESALIAYMLANDFISALDSYKHELSRITLRNTYEKTEGTSCKMALAWALYNMGDEKYWETFVYADYIWKKEFVQMWEDIIKKVKPNLNGKESKALLCHQFANPESTGLSIPGTEQPWGIIEFLALDIASNGRKYSKNPKWKRKARH